VDIEGRRSRRLSGVGGGGAGRMNVGVTPSMIGGSYRFDKSMEQFLSS
jgi:hypothetical protein